MMLYEYLNMCYNECSKKNTGIGCMIVWHVCVHWMSGKILSFVTGTVVCLHTIGSPGEGEGCEKALSWIGLITHITWFGRHYL